MVNVPLAVSVTTLAGLRCAEGGYHPQLGRGDLYRSSGVSEALLAGAAGGGRGGVRGGTGIWMRSGGGEVGMLMVSLWMGFNATRWAALIYESRGQSEYEK